MKVTQTHLEGCFVCEPMVFLDERGSFSETFNHKAFQEATGISVSFVQDNQSVSQKNVLRGLHFQIGDYAQSKLIRVSHGSILDVCVDLRPHSSTFLQYFKIELSASNAKQLFIPKGFAHGFLTRDENTIVCYKCDSYYNKPYERGIRFNDPSIQIDWEIQEDQLIISEKDKALPFAKEVLQL